MRVCLCEVGKGEKLLHAKKWNLPNKSILFETIFTEEIAPVVFHFFNNVPSVSHSETWYFLHHKQGPAISSPFLFVFRTPRTLVILPLPSETEQIGAPTNVPMKHVYGRMLVHTGSRSKRNRREKSMARVSCNAFPKQSKGKESGEGEKKRQFCKRCFFTPPFPNPKVLLLLQLFFLTFNQTGFFLPAAVAVRSTVERVDFLLVVVEVYLEQTFLSL